MELMAHQRLASEASSPTMSISLLLSGPGRLALDRVLGFEPD